MQLQIFEYESEREVRTVEIDGEIWWVASDSWFVKHNYGVEFIR